MADDTRPQIRPDRLKNLFRNLVDIYSPSGKEEEILEYTEEYLKKHDLNVIRQVVDENRYNLLVFPENKEASLYFIGHLDTITAYDLDAYGSKVKGNEVFGLGTADMKSGCAAMIEAFTVLTEIGKRSLPLGMALLIDEEEDNSGARVLIKEYNFQQAIIGEPTDLTPCLGHYAYLEVMMRTRGRRAHSAIPEAGQNAIENMLKLLLYFTEHENLRNNGLVYNIRDMTGFPGGFVVPDFCEAWLDLHLRPDINIDYTKNKLKNLLKEAKKNIPELDASLEFVSTYPGYRLANEEVLVAKLRKIFSDLLLPWEPQDFRSHSDGSVLSLAGVSPVILGPGRLESAHSPEESVLFGSVVLAAQVYLELALSLEI